MDVLTEPGHQAGRNVQASEENPRYEVWIPSTLSPLHPPPSRLGLWLDVVAFDYQH